MTLFVILHTTRKWDNEEQTWHDTLNPPMVAKTMKEAMFHLNFRREMFMMPETPHRIHNSPDGILTCYDFQDENNDNQENFEIWKREL